MRCKLKHIIPMVAAATLLTLSGCSTQKAKWANIQYHNINCHYNVWWNGNKSLRMGKEELAKKSSDDFTQILPVYKLGTREQAMGVNQQMDRAIEKGVKGVKKHSIYQKGKEHVPYVKKCYLLTAYGSFYKQDYADAANTCRMIASQYNGSSDADEARILLARCLTQQKQYIDAETMLDLMVNEYGNNDFDPKNLDKLYLAMVECTLPQEKYKKAVQYIRLALDETKDRQIKARLYYIMGQIYQNLDKRPTAQKYFKKVLSCRPDYVLDFNARISMASCSDVNHTNLAEQEKVLDKMLKEKKYEEFKDQIYYAKGEMYLGVKDAQKACDNYKLSVASATNNPAQKAKSALRMADVLYDVYENYDQAQSFYDTAMHVINSEYPHYDQIRDRHSMLTQLVEFTRKIDLNDSLIALADMDPKAREEMILKKIEEVKIAEEKAKEEALLAELKADAAKQQYSLEGDWYFYNHNTVQKGKDTFRQRWGNRTLEDYWFISNKGLLGMGGSLAMIEDEEVEADIEMDSVTRDSIAQANLAKALAAKNDPTNPHNVAYYLKDMPTRQGQRDTMYAEIATCLLNAGYIYYDGIENTDRALECYIRMATEYPDAPEIEQTFYQLYRIYAKQGNTPSANYYRDMVLMGFPDGDYANLIRDDQYYLELIRRNERANEEYANIYNLFRRRRYTDVIDQSRATMKLYNKEPMVGKLRYWEAMATMQTGNREQAIVLFDSIVRGYPDTSQIALLAKQQLDYLKEDPKLADALANNTGGEEITAEDEARLRQRESNLSSTDFKKVEEEELPVASQQYRFRENMQHYVMIIINDKKIVATQLQYKIADFNSKEYANMGYKSNPMMFTDTTQLITIHRFKNIDEVMKYYAHIQLEGGPLSDYDPKDYVIFPISTQNYTTFYRLRDIEAYRLFFERYYKKDY